MEFGKDMILAEKDMPEFGVSSEVNAERMAKFSIPIALAWKTLDSKNPNFFRTNLIPPAILEKQKPFKIDWHGWILMAFLFGIAFIGTLNNLGLKQQVVVRTRQVAQVEQELKDKSELARKLVEIRQELEQMVKEMERVEQLQGKRAHWDVIINELSKAIQSNPISWVEQLRLEGENIKLTIYSTSRKSLVNISQSLPNTRIIRIVTADTGNMAVWQCELTFSYPSQTDYNVEISQFPYNQDITIKD
jgi:Tfp pilus assembly protein PilN